jgi:transaldolase
MNPLKALQTYGQSVYMDEIRRSMLTDGFLKTLIERDGLRGVTSNPAIFQKAIAETNDYDDTIAELVQAGISVEDIYEDLVVEDIQVAADLFRPTYEASDGRFGYVSLEVNPHLAHDTEGTVKEARHLWSRLARPNVFIKVPGTAAGLPAITSLIREGINVNVTLLFGLSRYTEVAKAYVAGLGQRHAAGNPTERVASVASFFLSRIDVLLDPMLERAAQEQSQRAAEVLALRGTIAIASAKAAYQIYKEAFGTQQFGALANSGARTQRLLWASTSTKNPDYQDVMYVEPLIGQDTVNTLPVSTLNAYRDHGDPADRMETGIEDAQTTLAALPELGIDLDQCTQQLEDEGVNKFIAPFDSLMSTLAEAASTKPV